MDKSTGLKVTIYTSLFLSATSGTKPVVNQKLSPDPYLIFVISFTMAGFLNPNILHPKITKITQKLHQIAPKSVKYAVFRIQSGKFYIV